ncbi:hypothetical protein DCC62_21305 [candidate division KSB1 bacterium]|nr:MAG: hypothetical protein DCC62_21305 [candidate division KSB1 bacterium]
MPAYNTFLFDPPAPIAKVTLRNLQNGLTLPDVALLIDSGSDITIVPQASANHIGVPSILDASYQVEGFKGSPLVMPVAILEMLFLNRIFKGQFLLTDQDYVILGRNVLNNVAILLNGPGLSWDEYHLFTR